MHESKRNKFNGANKLSENEVNYLSKELKAAKETYEWNPNNKIIDESTSQFK